jgi:DNA-directed RNA polymerase specialized sigma24 family protein
MGRGSANGNDVALVQGGSGGGAGRRSVATQKRRFGTYFPRVFACVYALTGDETVAKDVVCEAFGQVFDLPAELLEEEFIVELFTRARDLSRATRESGAPGGGLTIGEQEVLALVFDARLTREEIRRLVGTTEQGLSATLLLALRKLQEEIAPARATA